MSNHREPHIEPEPPETGAVTEADAADTAAEPSPTGTTAATATAPPKSRARLVAAVILTVAALFGGAVVAGGLWLTGHWDGPSTDDPAESVDGFLTALFTEHDAEAANTYTCASQSGDLGQIVGKLDAAAAAQFTWAKVGIVSREGGNAVVTAKITHVPTGDTATWTFALATGDPDDAWRVCGVYVDGLEGGA